MDGGPETRSRLAELLDGLTMADLEADGVLTLEAATRELKAKGFDPADLAYLYE